MNDLWNKWLNKTITKQEFEALKQTDDFEIYLKIVQKSEKLEPIFTDDTDFLSKIISEKTIKKLWPLWTKIAAVLVVGILIFIGFETQEKSKYLASTQKTFSLPDASQVILNTGATANFKSWNWQNNRNLNLEGEAYFMVAKGKTFDVKTPNGTITVVGTKFCILSKNKTFNVVCFEGKVKVSNKKNTVYITKNQAVSQNEAGVLKQNEVFVNEPSWINNQLVFEDQSFKNVITALSENFNVNFNINQFKTGNNFTGKLPSKNLKLALEILSKTYHFSYKTINNQTVMISIL